MVGIVVVTHSAKLGDGLVELVEQMAGSDVSVLNAGGLGDELGTDEGAIRNAIEGANRGSGVVVLMDLGSSVLTARHIVEPMSEEVRLADAPLVEGAIAAAVCASAGQSLDAVVSAAEEVRGGRKL